VSEGIIFRRYLPRGLRSAALRLFAPTLTQEAVDSAVVARLRNLRDQGGFPGLREVAEVVARPSECLMTTLSKVDELCRGTGHQNANFVAQRARWLLQVEDDPYSRSDPSEIASRIAEFVLRDYIGSGFFPRQLISELVEAEVWSTKGIEDRRAEFFGRLLTSDPFRAAVEQLVSDPTGGQISLPKISKAKPDVSDLVHMSLTEEVSMVEVKG
jgi:hypothetical protein